MENKACGLVDKLIEENIDDEMKKYINMPLFRDDLINNLLQCLEDWKKGNFLDEAVESNINFIFVKHSSKKVLNNIVDSVYILSQEYQ